MRNPSTESPRNSSCSLSVTGVPPLRDSLASELWVSARFSSSGSEKWCSILSSRLAGSARIGGRELLLVARVRRGGLDVRRHLLDLRMQLGVRQHLVANRNRLCVLAR